MFRKTFIRITFVIVAAMLGLFAWTIRQQFRKKANSETSGNNVCTPATQSSEFFMMQSLSQAVLISRR
jgi:hypothetical protein